MRSHVLTYKVGVRGTAELVAQACRLFFRAVPVIVPVSVSMLDKTMKKGAERIRALPFTINTISAHEGTVVAFDHDNA